MELVNAGKLSEKEQKDLLKELKPLAKKFKNAASTGELQVSITGKLVKGTLENNCSAFAVKMVYNVEKPKTLTEMRAEALEKDLDGFEHKGKAYIKSVNGKGKITYPLKK